MAISLNLEESRELKARALEEAAGDVGTVLAASRHVGEWLMERASLVRVGKDPAIPPEPLTAGSLAFTRDGGKYLRWCDGSSHTVSPWLRTMEHAEDFYRYADLDVVRVIAGPEEWPT